MQGYVCDFCDKFIANKEPYATVRAGEWDTFFSIGGERRRIGYWKDCCESCWDRRVEKAIDSEAIGPLVLRLGKRETEKEVTQEPDPTKGYIY